MTVIAASNRTPLIGQITTQEFKITTKMADYYTNRSAEDREETMTVIAASNRTPLIGTTAYGSAARYTGAPGLGIMVEG